MKLENTWRQYRLLGINVELSCCRKAIKEK